MRITSKISFLVFIFIVLFLHTACVVSFEKGWEGMPHSVGVVSVEDLIQKAAAYEKNAETTSDVYQIIEAYKEVEKADPLNYQALWKIGNYKLLLGAGHTQSKKQKAKHYIEAIKYCEKAMFTHDSFKKAISNGNNITEAAIYLTKNEIDAMGYWYTARFYFFKDCISPIKRAFNTQIIVENNKMIDLIDKLDANWAGGGNYFSRALYYIALPERFGGSKERAEKEFAKAVEVGPNYIVNRWGRAKYLYSITGDKEAYIADLHWVVQQNPKTAENPHAWNVYFINDAKKMLTRL